MPHKKHSSQHVVIIDDGDIKEYEDEDEEEEEEEEPPDLPIWFGVLLIVVCVLSCAGYFSLTERYSFGLSVYYSFLFFLAGDFYTDQYNLAVPTYLFLFLGFATVSTTISIVLYNIENLMKRVKKNLNKEIKELQEKIERGEIELGDGVNAEDLIEEILKKSAPAYLRASLPKTKFTELTEVAQEEAVRVVEEIKEEKAFAEEVIRLEAEAQEHAAEVTQISEEDETEARTPTPPPPPPVELVSSAMQTEIEEPQEPEPPPPPPEMCNTEVQCGGVVTSDCGSATEPLPQSSSVESQANWIAWAGNHKSSGSNGSAFIFQADAGSQVNPVVLPAQSQCEPVTDTSSSNTVSVEQVDASEQSKPKTRTVKTQFPKSN